MKKSTVAIGIPAYNEEKNIKRLLSSIILQKEDGFDITEIIVVSDGSTDSTVGKAKKLQDKRIKIIANKKRMGKYFALNTIKTSSNSDVLAFLDADTEIKDKEFISKIVSPILLDNKDLVGVRVEELEPRNNFQRVLNNSMKFKKEIFESYNNGDNIYTCHGRAIAMSRRFYKRIIYKESIVADDAYAFLYCKKNNYNYSYAKSANIYYNLPKNIADHEKQSVRFLTTKTALCEEFGEKFVVNHYKIPSSVLMSTVYKSLLSSPFFMSQYFMLLFLMKFKSTFKKKIKSDWEVAYSSK